MSSLRKNEAIQLSEVFVDSMTQEYWLRMEMGKLDILQKKIDSETHVFCGRQRKHYNLLKIEQQGRSKLIMSDKGIHMTMFEELMDWALKSKSE